MANRDKSQRLGFVYTNIYEIYKKAQAAGSSPALTSNTRVLRAEELGDLKITNFQPRELGRSAMARLAPVDENSTNLKPGVNPFEDLKANMHRLQDLHSKLRFMLKELEDLVAKK